MVNKIFEAVSKEDREKIKYYIKHYSDVRSFNLFEEKYSFENVFSEWAAAKSSFFKTFGEKLIIKKDVEFNEEKDEIENKIDAIVWKDLENREFREKIMSSFPWPDDWQDLEARQKREAVANLFSITTLRDNKYHWDGETVIMLPNKKKLILKEGIKPMKALRKIAEAYHIPGFEKFCNDHSMCLNTKTLKGKLCLSIHPLDYFTMSDNNSDWRSCMRWRDGGGEYRQGTVEMMNSPNVVLAYLEGSEPYTFGQYSWNNKKWRVLFIVTDDLITSVKEYPYHNESLVSAAAVEIAKLKGYTNQKVECYPEGSITDTIAEFYTYVMYNDMDCCYDNYAIVERQPENREITYSGTSQCVCCGRTDENFSGGCQNYVVCRNCGNWTTCEDCGYIITDDDYYNIDGHTYCGDCIGNHYFYDRIAGEYMPLEDEVTLYLSSNKVDTIDTKIYNYHGNWERTSKEGLEIIKDNHPEIADRIIIDVNTDIDSYAVNIEDLSINELNYFDIYLYGQSEEEVQKCKERYAGRLLSPIYLPF